MQFIAYATADLDRLRGWLADSGAALAVEVLLVLGAYAGPRDGRPQELPGLLQRLDPDWGWSVCAFGPAEAACLVVAAALGGGVRVGFENNLWLPDGRVATDNAELVRHLVDALACVGLRPASAEQTCARFLRG
ncbi:3-keto-5-aminohexanoate cleavage enzyme [mine drainage metagenome]|uniref:3-keto-5-aminohexanoate cleavage enzyme n=1 Tax=mine drainage metagenome TaxID=410659 RepID=A0A1J5QLB5_9ZZZZ